jgi:hypothetical protein
MRSMLEIMVERDKCLELFKATTDPWEVAYFTGVGNALEWALGRNGSVVPKIEAPSLGFTKAPPRDDA